MSATASTRPVIRRNVDQQRTLLHRFALSRLSAQEFCRQEGLSLSSFRRWQHAAATASRAAGFVELRSPAAAAPADDRPWTIEIELPGGVQLRLQGGR